MYRGIFTARPTEAEGIQIIYLPDRKMIRIDGWFSSRQGTLQAVEMPLSEFLQGLDISLEDCRQALGSTSSATTAYTTPPGSAPVSAEHSPRNAMETPAVSSSDTASSTQRTIVNPK